MFRVNKHITSPFSTQQNQEMGLGWFGVYPEEVPLGIFQKHNNGSFELF